MFEFLQERFARLAKRLSEKTLTEEDVERILRSFGVEFIEADVCPEVWEELEKEIKERLAEKSVKRGEEERAVVEFFKGFVESRLEECKKLDFLELVERAREEKGYATLIFFGINGVGKSLTVAKVGRWLKGRGYKPIIAAADTYRAGSIEQLETYASVAGIRVVKHSYGADACAVVYDARKAAEARGFDVVLADTSGRIHTQRNLIDELKKIVRVNSPDLKILVLDSLSGRDALLQFAYFNEAVGIDAVIFTKVDVNEKGGNILSLCKKYRVPILFLGTGQGIEDLREFSPREIVRNLFQE